MKILCVIFELNIVHLVSGGGGGGGGGFTSRYSNSIMVIAHVLLITLS